VGEWKEMVTSVRFFRSSIFPHRPEPPDPVVDASGFTSRKLFEGLATDVLFDQRIGTGIPAQAVVLGRPEPKLPRISANLPPAVPESVPATSATPS